MSNYNPPTENITAFNTSLFNQPEVILSQAEADLLYLSKTKNDTSTATLTTFNGQMEIKNNLTIGVRGVAQGIVNIYRRMRFWDIDNIQQTYGDLVGQGNDMKYYCKNDSATPATTHQFYTRASGSATDNLQITISNGITRIPASIEVGTNGINTTPAYFRTDLRLVDVGTPYNNYCQFYTGGNTMNYIMNAGTTTSTFHSFTAYNNANLSRAAFTVGYSNVSITDGVFLSTRQITSSSTASNAHEIFTNMITGGVLTIGNALSTNFLNGATTFAQQLILNSTLTSYFRFNHASTTYAFPFSGPTIQGYYLKETGTGTSVTSATPKTILTTSSIPIGVWRIDFSVQNVVGATGAGTITQAQSYISTTLNGAVATAVPFTGSILRTHVSEVYGNNDVQIITSNITYNQSTAGVLYLNIVRTFSSGTYSFTGEVGLTRIA